MPAIIGKPAPDFTAQAVLPGGEIKEVKLSDYRGARADRGAECFGRPPRARHHTR